MFYSAGLSELQVLSWMALLDCYLLQLPKEKEKVGM